MPIPAIAAILARVAATVGPELAAGAAARGGAVTAARAGAAAEGAAWRSAMFEAKGDKALAKRIIQQQGRNAKLSQGRGVLDWANDQANDWLRGQIKGAINGGGPPGGPPGGGDGGGMISRIVNRVVDQIDVKRIFERVAAASVRAIDDGTRIIQNDYRGLVSNHLPAPIGEFVQALGRLTDAINSRARELAPFNGRLAVATTTADVRQLRADMYEGQVAGGAYSRVVDESSKLQTGLQETFAPLKALIADHLADMLEIINYLREMAPSIRPILDSAIEAKVIAKQGFKAVVDAVTPFKGFPAAARDLAEIPDKIKEKMQEVHGENKEDPFADVFKNSTMQFPPEQTNMAQIGPGGRFGMDHV
jgi:methyl-accepting chemotaxis protein